MSPAQAIYRHGSRTRYNQGKPIVWRRLHELEDADANLLSLVEDGASAGDVVQVTRPPSPTDTAPHTPRARSGLLPIASPLPVLTG